MSESLSPRPAELENRLDGRDRLATLHNLFAFEADPQFNDSAMWDQESMSALEIEVEQTVRLGGFALDGAIYRAQQRAAQTGEVIATLLSGGTPANVATTNTPWQGEFRLAA